MFTQKWKDHWGLTDDPFSCEDADKDILLSEIETSAVHSSFDKMFGNPLMPSPAIVFGEKGSGKSALRLIMRRRIQEFNGKNPEHKIFHIEYIDFNNFIEYFRRIIRASKDDRQASHAVVEKWRIADHLDAILSMGVTKFIDEILDNNIKVKDLSRKQKVDIHLLTALYYHSEKQNTADALLKLKKQLGYIHAGPNWRPFIAGLVSLLGLAIALLPFFAGEAELPKQLFGGTGLATIAAAWVWIGWREWSFRDYAASAARNIRVFARNAMNIGKILKGLTAKERKEFVLPLNHDESSRFQLLKRFMGLLSDHGYKGFYILIDRVDEPSLLSNDSGDMREFIEKILDIKFLQYENLGLKLFLPIELDEIHRNASPEQLKKMRLDKSNLIPELKWNGMELYEIANQRMLASKVDPESKLQLKEMFEEGFDFEHMKETLSELGTPRHAFSFLSAVFSEYIRTLPNDLDGSDPKWKVPRSHFDVIKAQWVDKSGVLRRVLN
jgi:hypothetical protein